MVTEKQERVAPNGFQQGASRHAENSAYIRAVSAACTLATYMMFEPVLCDGQKWRNAASRRALQVLGIF